MSKMKIKVADQFMQVYWQNLVFGISIWPLESFFTAANHNPQPTAEKLGWSLIRLDWAHVPFAFSLHLSV